MTIDDVGSGATVARIRLRSAIVRYSSSVAIVAGLWGMTGCAPSFDQLVDDSLADSVENAQDDLWDYRRALVTDPEQTIAEVGFLSDARPIYDDPAHILGGAQYTLLAASSSAKETTLTLVAIGGAQTGGGWWYKQGSAVVCFDLRFPADEEAIYTESSDCTDGEGHGLADIAVFAQHGEPIPLDQLDVRRAVTKTDYPPPICQCHSGGDCDCPGG